MIKPTNQEIAAVFKHCLQFLSTTQHDRDGKCEYICWALDSAHKHYQIAHSTISYIKREIIYPRLNGYGTMLEWLFRKHGIGVEFTRANDGRDMQTHRRRWVEQMIEEFSA
jgi:hypothetical protein